MSRCTVGDVTGEGHGTSKKAGKQQAAENVLNQLKAGIVPGEEKPEVKSEIPENVSLSYGGEINPVGTLQVFSFFSEVLQKKNNIFTTKFYQKTIFRSWWYLKDGAYQTTP